MLALRNGLLTRNHIRLCSGGIVFPPRRGGEKKHHTELLGRLPDAPPCRAWTSPPVQAILSKMMEHPHNGEPTEPIFILGARPSRPYFLASLRLGLEVLELSPSRII